MTARRGEHNSPIHDSERAKHFYKNTQNSYNWPILENASKHTSKNNKEPRSEQERTYIASLRPSLNNQLKSN